MGCDIHSFAEVKREGKWQRETEQIFSPNDSFGKTTEPFGWRSYGMFGFLADVRNYSRIPCITGEPRGLPDDSEYLNSAGRYDEDTTRRKEVEDDYDYHSKSHIYLRQLLDFNYDDTFEDLRYTQQTGPNSFNGAAVAEPGSGSTVTFREFLGEGFFEDLKILSTLGEPDDVRIVFWFDN